MRVGINGAGRIGRLALRAALGDPNWMGFPNEAYVFAAFVYFILCFGMSKYSQRLERVLSPETRR